MSHVSKRKLNKKVYQKIGDEFIQFVLELKSSAEAKSFLTNLLTKTERIMLAKRLAVIGMLIKGYSFEAIQKTLQISPSTIDRFWKILQQYPNSFSIIRSKVEIKSKSQSGFWKILGNFLESLSMVEKGKRRRINIMRKTRVKISYLGTSKKVIHYNTL
ncbi:MAG TPA: Trp family transcriptional regulator [Candidatus Paceibacterota bacterium]